MDQRAHETKKTENKTETKTQGHHLVNANVQHVIQCKLPVAFYITF
jgi:hypothetical protein